MWQPHLLANSVPLSGTLNFMALIANHEEIAEIDVERIDVDVEASDTRYRVEFADQVGSTFLHAQGVFRILDPDRFKP